VPAIPPAVHADDEVRAWFAEVVLATHEVWVADANRFGPQPPIVGVLVLDEQWIDQLYVDPGWTGRGLGSRLVDKAKELRPAGLQLWTFRSNQDAQRFYERHGFVAVETTDGDDEEHEPDVRGASARDVSDSFADRGALRDTIGFVIEVYEDLGGSGRSG